MRSIIFFCFVHFFLQMEIGVAISCFISIQSRDDKTANINGITMYKKNEKEEERASEQPNNQSNEWERVNAWMNEWMNEVINAWNLTHKVVYQMVKLNWIWPKKKSVHT